MLSQNDKKEQISLAYVKALASSLGYAYNITNIDRDSIDIEIRASGQGRPAIGVQLKATSSPDWKEHHLAFQLPKKNFNDLAAQRQVPAILVVMELPQNEDKWLICTDEHMLISRAAWWVSLCGQESIEKESKIVHLPKNQIFDKGGLTSLIEKSREGTI